jgi:hypothetical protein
MGWEGGCSERENGREGDTNAGTGDFPLGPCVYAAGTDARGS